MPSSTPLFSLPADFFLKILDGASILAGQVLRTVAVSVWDVVSSHWEYVLLLLFTLFFIAGVKMFFGEWGMMGSFLYHFIYIGVLGIIIAIFGIEILLSSYFDLVYLLLYPISYGLVSVILGKR